MAQTKVGTLEGIAAQVARCRFGDLKFVVSLDDDRPVLQIVWDQMDALTGQPKAWSGRKWFISLHATHSEVIQTVLKAVLTFIEHEARENFFVDGFAIFDPHYDIERLIELRRRGADAMDVRMQAAA